MTEPRYFLVACSTCDEASSWPATPMPFPTARRRDWWRAVHAKAYPDHEMRTWEEA